VGFGFIWARCCGCGLDETFPVYSTTSYFALFGVELVVVHVMCGLMQKLIIYQIGPSQLGNLNLFPYFSRFL
jgi:hypothetical protein